MINKILLFLTHSLMSVYLIPVGHRTRTQNSPSCRSDRAVTLLLMELQAAGLKTVETERKLSAMIWDLKASCHL